MTQNQKTDSTAEGTKGAELRGGDAIPPGDSLRSPRAPRVDPAPPIWLFFGLGLLSASALAFEVGLTRLFSVLYYPPAVFAILSLAVLGVGMGAGAAAGWGCLRRPDRLPATVALAALAALAVIIVAVNNSAPASTPLGWLTFLLVPLPFAGVGMALAQLFSRHAAHSPTLYWADLLGAGLGAVAVVPLLNLVGVMDGLLAAAGGIALAGLLLKPSRAGMQALLPGSALLAALGLMLLPGAATLLTVDMARLPTDKPISANMVGGILATQWDAFARTDLVDPGDGSAYRLYMDGGAGSVMPPAPDNATDSAYLWEDIGLFPFATEQPQRVFVIGPGGGLDVWFGIQGRAAEIVGVEVNPASVDLVRAFGAYNGDLYDQSQVRILVDEGRSVLERELAGAGEGTGAGYDLIFLSHVVTLAAEGRGYALVENSALTVEAFQGYLDALTPSGQIGLKLYDELTLSRATTTALAAFQRRGLSDADGLARMMIFLDNSVDPAIPLLLVRNQPYDRDAVLSLAAVARQVGFTPLYLPGVLVQPPLDQVAAGTASVADLIADSESNISPTTDDRPFFYQFERGLPQDLWPVAAGMAVVLLLTAGLVVLVQRRAFADGESARWAWSPLYFGLLGMGFMTVEIGLIQQTRLVLGHPTLAVTVVLAVLLVGGGLGSLLAGRLIGSNPGIPARLAGGVLALLVAWLILWPGIGATILGGSSLLRLGMVALLLLPLALAMGTPFPLGLRAVGRFGDRQVALAWAVNGVTTVAGSVLAVVVALMVGYTAVIGVGMICYAGAGVVALVMGR